MPDAVAMVSDYLAGLARIRGTGAARKETSYYGPLENLLNAVGQGLKPKVHCVGQLADRLGVGSPDFGLFAHSQIQRGEPREGAMPERGVVEVKGPGDDTVTTAGAEQVTRYYGRFNLVLVTNYRAFALVGPDAAGRATVLERFNLASSESAFWELTAHPQRTAKSQGAALVEYLNRVLTVRTRITEPRDLAWLLASYARDALARVEGRAASPGLVDLKKALEDALGIGFQGDKALHFFHSTLVQTLFYGLFSAWVLWAESDDAKRGRPFEWQKAVWYLRVPLLSALFGQITQPTKLKPLGLVEVMDWAEAALARVDRTAFLARFEESEAIQYFYEPFLAAFDPQLRDDLGVWYTPREVVRYMVERVDRSLREELGEEDGLASENVYVLDPCCGTGAFLAEVLRRIHRTLDDRGLGTMLGQKVKKAALERIYGFEIMPAPFAVAHMQIGLYLQSLQSPLGENERAGVYLTNALTGWQETGREKQLSAFPEFVQERDLATHVKREKPILVVLGNPPYNGYAGLAVEEERALVDAYRVTRKVRRPEGQGLNDLYVRFFRMAERRIAEQTGRGVVCFISNYSWLDGLSFTGMRERYLREFDVIRIDCLNGDKYKTGKVTPDGEPDPSIFSTEYNREGIQVGTAIALLTRAEKRALQPEIGFRHIWGRGKWQRLQETAEAGSAQLYVPLDPRLETGLPLLPAEMSASYFDWPRLPDLFPVSFPGVTTSRDEFLVDDDKVRLEERLIQYFDHSIEHSTIAARYPVVMERKQRFDPVAVRSYLQQRGFLRNNIVMFSYRPFDNRWLYWEPETKLLDEKRSQYFSHVFHGNWWIEARERQALEEFSRGNVTSSLADSYGNGRSSFFPMYLLEHSALLAEGAKGQQRRQNLSGGAGAYLQALSANAEALFWHSFAIMHAPSYKLGNAGALRLDWPHIPLPRVQEAIELSAHLGQRLAALFDTVTAVPQVTEGAPRPELRLVAVPAQPHRSGLDTKLAVGWGYRDGRGAVMPGQGKTEERSYTSDEFDVLAIGASALGLTPEQITALLGETTYDVWLNGDAYWRNVPAKVWRYKLGGYQVIKKWLSYREHGVLGRALRPDEVGYVQEMARRIAAILLMGPALDASYAAVKADPYPWLRG